MKKTILPIVLIVGLLAGVSSAVTIPRASVRQISAAPLSRGETTYVEGQAADEDSVYSGVKRLKRQLLHSAAPAMATSFAEMYIGGESGPLRVIDSSSLRGYKLRTLEPSEYSISAGALFSHDVAAGTYTMTSAGPTNAIVITAKDGVVIENVSIKTEFTGEGLIPGEFTCSENTYDGSVFRWECAFTRAASMIVTKIEVQAMDLGEIKWINDTIETVFMIHDLLGTYNLSDLRRWVRDLYNGNRGEDWSSYRARRAVRLNGQAVRFTDDNRFTMSMTAQTNLVLKAAMRTAMEVNVRTNAPIQYTTFRITSVNVGNSAVTMGFSTDIVGFSAANLGVMACDGLEDNVWLGLAEADYAVSGVSTSGGTTTGIVTVPTGVQGSKRFFRLHYGAAVTDTVDIVLHGRVIVKDLLIIKGTDSKFYRITVTNGTIYASETTL